jgi:hypothetical protein
MWMRIKREEMALVVLFDSSSHVYGSKDGQNQVAVGPIYLKLFLVKKVRSVIDYRVLLGVLEWGQKVTKRVSSDRERLTVVAIMPEMVWVGSSSGSFTRNNINSLAIELTHMRT